MTTVQIPGSQLRSFIERVERLEETKATISEDIGSVYSEAKSFGYDAATMRKVVAHRKAERTNPTRAEETAALLGLYLAALEQPAQPDMEKLMAPRSNVTVLHS